MPRVRVDVHLKKGVTDPEGDAVRKALRLLGFDEVTAVRAVKAFEIDMDGTADAAKTRAEEICRKLLANPVIHDYTIEVRQT